MLQPIFGIMKEILNLINQMSPYILLGFLLAGLMHSFVPHALYRRYLGGSSFKSVINAALLGVPLPLCSCGVIPTAMSLRKEGASKGATVSFLISTPQTGVDSIIATWSLMGLPFALLRPIAAFATALWGGLLTNRFSKDAESDAVSQKKEAVCSKVGCCSHDREKGGTKRGKSAVGKIREALNYAYVEMMQDIGKWLMAGLVIAGVITVFVPDSFFALFSDKPLMAMILVLVCAIPMYLCATGSIPIAVALMLKGLSPGTALVLLMAGPAVNAASILVISKVMGKRTMVLYLISIITGAMAFGSGIDYLLPRRWFTAPLQSIACHTTEATGWFNIACTLLLFILLANALYRRFHINVPAAFPIDSSKEASKETSTIRAEEAYKVSLKVSGMTCNHCRSNVEKAILGTDGVECAQVDLASGIAIYTGKAKAEEVIKSIKDLGFEAAPL